MNISAHVCMSNMSFSYAYYIQYTYFHIHPFGVSIVEVDILTEFQHHLIMNKLRTNTILIQFSIHFF